MPSLGCKCLVILRWIQTLQSIDITTSLPLYKLSVYYSGENHSLTAGALVPSTQTTLLPSYKLSVYYSGENHSLTAGALVAPTQNSFGALKPVILNYITLNYIVVQQIISQVFGWTSLAGDYRSF